MDNIPEEEEELTENQKLDIMQQFSEKILNSQVDFDSDIGSFVDQHLWELLG
jgi:hypothetical protein